MAKENPAAALAKKRWEGVSDEERRELMSEAGKASWENATEEERKARGAKLAAARAAKRKATGKKAAKKG
jgi:hypothetical protein